MDEMNCGGGRRSMQGDGQDQDQEEFINNNDKRHSTHYMRASIVICFCAFLLFRYDSKFHRKFYRGMQSTTFYFEFATTVQHSTDTLDPSIDDNNGIEESDVDIITDGADQNGNDDDVSTSIDIESTSMLNEETGNKKTYLTHFYHDLWNYTTNSITIPDKKPDDPITSLEILENILKQDDITKYMNATSDPTCFLPNINKTQGLVAKVESGNVTLGLPVLNAGFPKCGSSTLHAFFNCADYKSDHSQPGACMAGALHKGKPPIAGCAKSKGYETFLQLDVQNVFKKGVEKGCWYPQISFLDEFHNEHPNATFIIVFRPVDDWIRSVLNWSHMIKRMTICRENIPGLLKNPHSQSNRKKRGKKPLRFDRLTSSDMRHWWCNHIKHIREFVKQYPSHNLVELDLYNGEQSSQIMSKLFAMNRNDNVGNDEDDASNGNNDDADDESGNEACWGHANENKVLQKKLKIQQRKKENENNRT